MSRKKNWGVFHLPKTFGNFHGKVHRVKIVFKLTQVPFVYALVIKIQDGTEIVVNSVELVIPFANSNLVPRAFPTHFLREKPWGRGWCKLINGTCLENFQRENRTTFSKFHLFSGTFPWNAWKTCVPLTSQPEFPEFLGKWKSPLDSTEETGVDIQERRLGSSSPDPLRQDSVRCELMACSSSVPFVFILCYAGKFFVSTRKPYQIGPLFTHKNGDFGAISITERSCVPRPIS